ncbi:hypothetical protein [Candidatus Endomicrobiellum agilis]|uniref:hypothetical protein n=1 Tax=Candidatus Endomicrobiellum agilis TaxID=3238957 RepID=UPI00358C1160|nr:hypothetical protein [Endomicrobium sp.]
MRYISALLIGLMTAGCQPIQREPNRATNSKEAPVIYVQEAAVANPDTVSKEDYDKLQERFDTFKRHNYYYTAALAALTLVMGYLYLSAGSGEDLALRMVAELQERLTKVGNLFLKADRDRLDTEMFYEWLEQYMPKETWRYWRQSFLRFIGAIK